MIEKKINVGEFLDFGSTTGCTAPVGAGQVTLNCEDRTIAQSTNYFGPDKRAVEAGTNADKLHRNFVWLPWAENAINYTESQGKDVLSGLFTGCYMVVYNYKGSRRVGHIATPTAKEAWNKLTANDFDHEIVAGFKPSDAFPDPGSLLKKGDSGLVIFGLITATNDLYAIMAFIQAAGGSNAKHCRIAAVTKVTSIPVGDLMVLP